MRFKAKGFDGQHKSNHRVYQDLLSVARRIANRAGLDYHCREDYAARFASNMVLYHHADLLRYQRAELPECWLRKCAQYALQNYQRAEAIRRSHEIYWPKTEDEEGETIAVEVVATLPSTPGALLRQELLCYIEAALETLEPRNADLFRKRFVEGRTIAELVCQDGSNYDALRMRLERACRRIRLQLQRWGIDQEEAEEYLAAIEERSARGYVGCR
jgi:DNA-directed RNA polymerase specialized sigma24 family protein